MASARSRVGPSKGRMWWGGQDRAKNACFACSPSATGAARTPRVCVYAACGYIIPAGSSSCAGNARHLDRGYSREDEDRRRRRYRKIAKRIEAVLKEIGSEAHSPSNANGPVEYWRPRSPMHKCARYISDVMYEEAGRDPWISSSRPALAEYTPDPWRPARLSSAIRIATQTFIPIWGMGRPRPRLLQFVCAVRGYASISAPLACLQSQRWSPSRCIQHGGHQMSMNMTRSRDRLQ